MCASEAIGSSTRTAVGTYTRWSIGRRAPPQRTSCRPASRWRTSSAWTSSSSGSMPTTIDPMGKSMRAQFHAVLPSRKTIIQFELRHRPYELRHCANPTQHRLKGPPQRPQLPQQRRPLLASSTWPFSFYWCHWERRRTICPSSLKRYVM